MGTQAGQIIPMARAILHPFLVLIGAAGFTLAFFMVLPLMQTLTKPPSTNLMLQQVDTAKLDAPPPPPEPEKEEEPEPEEEPPKLMEEAPPLSLSDMELALNPGSGGGWMGGAGLAPNLKGVVLKKQDSGPLFSIADLDQKPRVIYQPGPTITNEVRKLAPGTVHIIFVVDERGRVDNPIIQKSSHPIFERAALSAVKKWKFEPGKRNGEPVRFRMRVPITFPKGV